MTIHTPTETLTPTVVNRPGHPWHGRVVTGWTPRPPLEDLPLTGEAAAAVAQFDAKHGYAESPAYADARKAWLA